MSQNHRLEDVSDVLVDSPDTAWDLIDARRNVQEYHRQYGMPMVIKRAYNSDHIAFQQGPQGESVQRDRTFDPAYGGGFYSNTAAVTADGFREYSPGWFLFGTLTDSGVDDSDPGEHGAKKIFRTNGEIPYIPLLWDNDLLILVEIQQTGPDSLEIMATEDRFIVQNVSLITMRGQATPFYTPNQEKQAVYFRDKARTIAQTFEAVRMPRYHQVYNIPMF